MAEGEFARTQRHLSAGLKIAADAGAPPQGGHDLYTLLVDTAVLERDADALRKYAGLAEQAARSIDHQLNLGIAHRAWGVAHTLAGEFAEAQSRLEQALQVFSAYPAPWQVGRTLFELALLAKAAGQKDKARAHLAKALDAFEGLQAVPDVRKAREALAALPAA